MESCPRWSVLSHALLYQCLSSKTTSEDEMSFLPYHTNLELKNISAVLDMHVDSSWSSCIAVNMRDRIWGDRMMGTVLWDWLCVHGMSLSTDALTLQIQCHPQRSCHSHFWLLAFSKCFCLRKCPENFSKTEERDEDKFPSHRLASFSTFQASSWINCWMVAHLKKKTCVKKIFPLLSLLWHSVRSLWQYHPILQLSAYSPVCDLHVSRCSWFSGYSLKSGKSVLFTINLNKCSKE